MLKLIESSSLYLSVKLQKVGLTLSLPKSNLESRNVDVPFNEILVCAGDHSMKDIEQYCHVVLFVFDNFA